MNIFFIGIGLFILSGFVSNLFKDNKIKVLSILNTIASILCIIPACKVLTSGETLVKSFEFNSIFNVVNFQTDVLSAFFVIIISIMSAITVIYSKGYLKKYSDISSQVIFFPLLTASMLLVVTCQNALMFLVCWEVMSLSSFFLVIFENEKKEVLKAGIKYLIFMHISVIFIMAAFAILAIKCGSFDFNSYHISKDLANIIFGLFFIGFGTKAGFVPFHNWLADAHPAAPSHVSAVMSGVMIKTGIYGILRVLTFIETPSKHMAAIVLIIGLITALYGILYAIGQNDIKKLLAYSSIENIGIIGIGMGFGMLGLSFNRPFVALLGFSGALLHILNHAIFKELLFMAAGSIYVKTHTRDIEKLGGLIKSMPKTAALFLTGSVAICALPPLNGFVGEFLIYLGMFSNLTVNNFFSLIITVFAISGLALVGTMALICFSKAFGIIFLGNKRSDITGEDENSMIIPMCILALFIILIGIFPDKAFMFVLRPLNLIFNDTQFITGKFIELLLTMKLVALYTFTMLSVIAILIYIKIKKEKPQIFETWGCGYNKADNRMQYTGSSYVSPFLSMLKPLFKKVFDIEKPRKLFPQSSHFNLELEDIEEAYLIKPLVKYDEWFLSKFEALQNGNIQSYIKYGLIFLVIILIGSLFVC